MDYDTYTIFIIIIGYISIIIFTISLWKIFVKARYPGWYSIIPFYNVYKLFEFTLGNGFEFLMLYFPLLNVLWWINAMLNLSELFGKSKLFGIGLIVCPWIFFPILAFDNSKYTCSYVTVHSSLIILSAILGCIGGLIFLVICFGGFFIL